jgi:Domain of unknown function (DUF6089)
LQAPKKHSMRFIYLLIFLLVFQLCSFAQSQIGIFGGIANYNGDLVEKAYQSSKGAVGLSYGYQLTSRINLRAQLTFAKIAGADSLSTHQDLRDRNLDFQSPITEFSLVGEYNTFDLENKKWSPFVFGGVAIFKFNPYTHDKTGVKTYLQPLGTEGQGLPGYSPTQTYGLTQFAIPFGAGIKYNLSDKFRLSAEVGLRKTFTDYMDDVSGNYADANDLLTARGARAADLAYRGDEVFGGDPIYPAKGETRGSPKYKDYYYFSGLHLVYLLGNGDGGNYKASKKKGYGCPTVF